MNIYARETRECFMLELTPGEASRIIEHHSNRHNRRLSRTTLERYVSDINNGTFVGNSLLHFGRDGTLLNGHHRLSAQIQANKSITYIISTGNSPEDVMRMDSGRNRTYQNNIEMYIYEQAEEQGIEREFLPIFMNYLINYISYAVNFIDSNRNSHYSTGVTCNINEAIEFIEEKGLHNLFDLIDNVVDLIDSNENLYTSFRSNRKFSCSRAIVNFCIYAYSVDQDFGKKFILSVFANSIFNGDPNLDRDCIFRGVAGQDGSIGTNKTITSIRSLIGSGSGTRTSKENEIKVWTIFSTGYNLLYKEYTKTERLGRAARVERSKLDLSERTQYIKNLEEEFYSNKGLGMSYV